MESVFITMQGLSFVKQLDLSFNNIGNVGASALATALKQDHFIEVLDLRSNSITGEGAAALSEAIEAHDKLVYLDLSDNPIGDEGGLKLASTLQVNTVLSSLLLSGCSIGATGLIALATSLQSSETIVELDLSNNILNSNNLSQSIMNDVIAHISRMVQLNHSITELSLAKLCITDWSMCDYLSRGIASNKTLQVLDLSL